MEVIWVSREEEYFFRKDWTGGITLILKENFLFAVIRHSQ
jgi:hypothetical protein